MFNRKIICLILAMFVMSGSSISAFAANDDDSDSSKKSNTIDNINSAFGNEVAGNISAIQQSMSSGSSWSSNFDTSSFLGQFQNYNSFASTAAFSVPNLSDFANKGIINNQFISLSNELKKSGFGQTTKLDTSSKVGYSQSAIELFNNTFGNKYNSISLDTGEIPESFSSQDVLKIGKQEREQAFAEAKNTDAYKTAHDTTSINSAFQKAQTQIHEYSLPSFTSLSSNVKNNIMEASGVSEQRDKTITETEKSHNISQSAQKQRYSSLTSALNKNYQIQSSTNVDSEKTFAELKRSVNNFSESSSK